ncbi:sugar-transfer associated ATP-grasp domain-containing protein [Planococcus versutus]|uniref:Hexapeptide transferase n=1 Tax=Planococcus versutus TaxID=1302659 RepID=A0A1B1S3B7_9BACL|nr:sugar-transfer associated ATP-grasp domain-containing protein [Planococcus versutus]ANU27673.1 hexapeptide transferase [Planococcus versutus]
MSEEKLTNAFQFERAMSRDACYMNDKLIQQHSFLNKIYPYALNTINLVTYCEDHTVSLLSASLEIGRIHKNTEFANRISEISCGLDHEGNLKSYAYDLTTLHKIYKHPQTRFVFEGSKIPHFNQLKSFAIQLHSENKTNGVISWKMALDSEGQAILLTTLMENDNLL